MKKIILITILFFSLAAFTGCNEKQTDVTVDVMLQNKSSEQVYLWVGHKAKPDNSDLVMPGQFKQVSLTLKAREKNEQIDEFMDKIRVNASRDGNSVQTSVLPAGDSYKEGGVYYIRYNGSFELDYQ